MTTTSIPLRVRPEPVYQSAGRFRTAWRRLRALGPRGCGLLFLHRVTGRIFLARFVLPGLEHPVHLRIGTNDFRDYWRTFVEGELDFDLGSPRVIVDGGSGAGLSTVWFASRYPMATVYALEMERSNFAVLDLNSAPYLNIVPARAAISGQVGMLLIANPGTGHWGFRLTDGPEGGQTVAGITLGRLFDHYGLDRVDVLKLGIEDSLAEEVFEDAANWIGRVDAIICSEQGDTPAAEAATAAFPVRSKRGGTRFFSRF
jgi:FkbM family methyltransferase